MSKNTFNSGEFKATVTSLAAEYDREVSNKKARSQHQHQSNTSTDSTRSRSIGSLTQEEFERLWIGCD